MNKVKKVVYLILFVLLCGVTFDAIRSSGVGFSLIIFVIIGVIAGLNKIRINRLEEEAQVISQFKEDILQEKEGSFVLTEAEYKKWKKDGVIYKEIDGKETAFFYDHFN